MAHSVTITSNREGLKVTSHCHSIAGRWDPLLYKKNIKIFGQRPATRNKINRNKINRNKNNRNKITGIKIKNFENFLHDFGRKKFSEFLQKFPKWFVLYGVAGHYAISTCANFRPKSCKT